MPNTIPPVIPLLPAPSSQADTATRRPDATAPVEPQESQRRNPRQNDSILDPQGLQRRVNARENADSSNLPTLREQPLPLPNQRALDTYQQTLQAGGDEESPLAGIDVFV